jgi:hypothetical protein
MYKLLLGVSSGGTREVWRQKGYQKYSLMWQGRYGFAELALKHGKSRAFFYFFGFND